MAYSVCHSPLKLVLRWDLKYTHCLVSLVCCVSGTRPHDLKQRNMISDILSLSRTCSGMQFNHFFFYLPSHWRSTLKGKNWLLWRKFFPLRVDPFMEGGLSLPRNSVVRLNDNPNMTIDVYG